MDHSLQTVGVVIPALNEADNLRILLPRLVGMGVGQVIIGDNGSTDGTGEVGRKLGVTVVVAPVRGYGSACWSAMGALVDSVDVVVFLDADCADDVSLLPALVRPVLESEADMVIGTRVRAMCETGAMSLPQRFGDRLATRLIRLGWRFEYGDMGPFRAIRRSSLDAIGMRDRAFGWTIEMQIRAVELGLRIWQLPVSYGCRRGRSKISGTVRGVMLAGYWILTTWGRLWWTRKQRG